MRYQAFLLCLFVFTLTNSQRSLADVVKNPYTHWVFHNESGIHHILKLNSDGTTTGMMNSFSHWSFEKEFLYLFNKNGQKIAKYFFSFRDYDGNWKLLGRYTASYQNTWLTESRSNRRSLADTIKNPNTLWKFSYDDGPLGVIQLAAGGSIAHYFGT